MFARRPVLLALAAAALLAGGCGGDDDGAPGGSTNDQIRAVFRTYTAALADKEYGKACAQLTAGSKAAITEKLVTRKAAVEKLTGSDETPSDCPGQFRLLLGAELTGGKASEKTRDELLRASTKARIDEIRVEGDAGTVQVTVPLDGVSGVPPGTPPQQSLTAVRRENGAWKIDER